MLSLPKSYPHHSAVSPPQGYHHPIIYPPQLSHTAPLSLPKAISLGYEPMITHITKHFAPCETTPHSSHRTPMRSPQGSPPPGSHLPRASNPRAHPSSARDSLTPALSAPNPQTTKRLPSAAYNPRHMTLFCCTSCHTGDGAVQVRPDNHARRRRCMHCAVHPHILL